MALSAAEKQRRYRARRDQDPLKRAAYLAKHREKYRQDIKNGKRTLASNMTKRQHRAAKKKWRTEKKDLRQRNKLAASRSEWETPPNSPEYQIRNENRPRSRQKVQASKKDKKEKMSCYRENEELQKKLNIAERKVEMYRKRWERSLSNKDKNQDTPRTKTKKLLKNFSSKTIRKTLDFHHALIDQIKKAKKGANRKTLVTILAGQILKKYKFRSLAMQQMGMKVTRGKNLKKGCFTKNVMNRVYAFFERDDVSRLLTGQKKTITKNKVKKQKRLLCDTLSNLHRKFQTETKAVIGYSTFCKLRPFWVVQPNEKDRDTCLCKICENMRYMAETLCKHDAITTRNLETLVAQTVYSTDKKDCMYSDCVTCKDKLMSLVVKDVSEEVTWMEWKSVRENREMKSGDIKTITLTVKKEVTGTLADLADKFHDGMLNVSLYLVAAMKIYSISFHIIYWKKTFYIKPHSLKQKLAP